MRAQRCRLCGYRVPPEAEAINALGTLGRVHAACFERYDLEDEVRTLLEIMRPGQLELTRAA